MPILRLLLLARLVYADDGTFSAQPVPGVLRFTRLWVSSDGHTHLQDCTMKQTEKKLLRGGKSAQYVRDLSGVLDPTNLTFTQMAADTENPWHQCPTAQFVVTLSGSWRVNTTDGSSIEMGAGHVLFQDNYQGLQVNGTQPQHFSAAVGGACNQLIVSAATRKVVLDDQSCDFVWQ
eukprot:TRINITY_DN90825_c0_g1_i1.p1 TRINITY_DN90825_c0_g1~~TRINITY_DN90825_c0_g1_i1.p1  ORF type:complete len:176 (-),score=17.75 TRINITY_DN90825_c0_g1_i1:348-875(-)